MCTEFKTVLHSCVCFSGLIRILINTDQLFYEQVLSFYVASFQSQADVNFSLD